MNRLRAALLAVAVAVPLALTACADSIGPAAPEAQAERPAPRTLLALNLLSVKAVEWNSGHVQGTYSVSGVIGKAGGKLSIPQSDFTIAFDPGAVSSPTRVTITSLGGKYVAYDMKPHGITFSAPVTVSQGLEDTKATYLLYTLKGLMGAYVDNDDPPAPDGSFTATELLPSVTYLTKTVLGLLVPVRQTWKLKHFSRYMLASG